MLGECHYKSHFLHHGKKTQIVYQQKAALSHQRYNRVSPEEQGNQKYIGAYQQVWYTPHWSEHESPLPTSYSFPLEFESTVFLVPSK